MTTASVAQITSQFGEYLKASEDAPVVVTKNGKPVAVMVGVQDRDDMERLLMACSPRLQAILAASRKQVRQGRVLGHKEFWAKVEASRASKRRGRKRESGRTNK